MKDQNRPSLLSPEMKDMFAASQQQLQQTLITQREHYLLSKLINKL